MPVAWDTTLVSRLRPGSDELGMFAGLLETAESPLLPATAVAEVAFGLETLAREHPGRGSAVPWIAELVRRPGVRVITFTALAALVAGRLRAHAPFPIAPRRRDHRIKPERRVSWINDIAIAATAWTVGAPVATENVADFERIAGLLAELYPRAIRLEVRPSPL